MSKKKNRLVVVLGMHRSGTSAITRGLEVLGVELGDDLIPPQENDNEKGFFEDNDVIALDEKLLKTLGRNWETLSQIQSKELEQDGLKYYDKKAAEIIRSRIGDKPFGLKDPRIARLLPFWQSVFKDVGVNISYVIAVRNPMSVAMSLKKRDGIAPAKSFYLWLQHMLPAINQTNGYSRVVVDFDLLMEKPESQLARIASAIDLQFDTDSIELKKYTEEFLDRKLRHSEFILDDLYADSSVPVEVIKVYELLYKTANDRQSIDSPEVLEIFKQFDVKIQSLSPLLEYVTHLEEECTNLMGKAQELSILKYELENITQSKSWKLTAPLRSINSKIKSIIK